MADVKINKYTEIRIYRK